MQEEIFIYALKTKTIKKQTYSKRNKHVTTAYGFCDTRPKLVLSEEVTTKQFQLQVQTKNNF